MTGDKQHILALDVGERRIGVAYADAGVRVAAPVATINVDGNEIDQLNKLLSQYSCGKLVVGLPRNQNGEETLQTAYVQRFVDERLALLGVPIVFQDESLTSVLAEEHLQKTKKKYEKADIDMHAAAIILSDYLEGKHGH